MCANCDPPSEWIHLVPYRSGSTVERGFWFVASAVVAWWERTVDAIRERRQR
jgi:hypothetical protein